MGPRLVSRGKDDRSGCLRTLDRRASMGPRLVSRGKEAQIREALKVIDGFNGAATC